MGKLIFGFVVFWAYIAFSQFMLIWYANIPEETGWYADRLASSWGDLALVLLAGHFIFPFLFFMSRHVKRSIPLHTFMALWLVFMHYLDMYWIIMPNATPNGVSFSVMDIIIFLAMGFIYVSLFLYRMNKHAIYPINDPRLNESIKLKVY